MSVFINTPDFFWFLTVSLVSEIIRAKKVSYIFHAFPGWTLPNYVLPGIFS